MTKVKSLGIFVSRNIENIFNLRILTGSVLTYSTGTSLRILPAGEQQAKTVVSRGLGDDFAT